MRSFLEGINPKRSQPRGLVESYMSVIIALNQIILGGEFGINPKRSQPRGW